MTNHLEDINLALEILQELRGELLSGDSFDGDGCPCFLRGRGGW